MSYFLTEEQELADIDLQNFRGHPRRFRERFGVSLFRRLERQLSRSGLSVGNRKTLKKVLNYLRRNRPYMDYQH